MPMFRIDGVNTQVSDDYLQGLLRSYRQGYTDARGPDFEDSDLPLLHYFENQGITTNAQAYQAGANQAAVDIGAGQSVNVTPGWTAGVSIPNQAPLNPPGSLTSNPDRGDASIYGQYQRSAGAYPSNATSGPPGPLGYASNPELTGYAPSAGLGSGAPVIFGLDMMSLLMLAGVGLAGYYFLVARK